MSWFWTIIFLGLTFSTTKYFVAEAARHHQKKLSSAVVVGTVYCDTCFQQDSPKASHFIEGASVAVECKDSTNSRPNFQREVKTNKHGEFRIHLPFSVNKHTKKIKGCSVKLISSNEPFCAVAATATSSNLHLKSRKQETHIFSAGFFTFKPLNQPQVCDQKPINKNPQNAEKLPNPNDPTFFPPIQDPPSDPSGRFLLPNFPSLPQLPPLPRIPSLPPISNKEKESQLLDKKVNQQMSFPFPPFFPPNPLLPPPSLIPPIIPSPPPPLFPPIFPSPPPSLFPPLFPTPSPPSLFPPLFPQLPPIPGLVPSPPPPVFPIPIPFPPFPPFPFQPTPRFPGVPPAVVSSQSKTSSP